MPLPADTGIAGHGDCEPSAHSLGAQSHGVLLGKCAASLHSESRSEYVIVTGSCFSPVTIFPPVTVVIHSSVTDAI